VIKRFVVRCTYTDRKTGPGTGRVQQISATNLPRAAKKAADLFWADLARKARIDCERDGLEIRITKEKTISCG
jgi:hypothetical protein